MISSHFKTSLFTAPKLAALAGMVLSALGVCHAQSGSFIIPGIRADGGTDFAYWDYFNRPPGAPTSTNYNYPNPPALIDGFGEDADGNPSTAFEDRTVLIQTGTDTAFITSSGAIYSFAEELAIEVPYEPPASSIGEVTNVIFQTQTGGARLNVNSVFLTYQDGGGQTVTLAPDFKGLDDPQSGAFTERIVCAFQWNLTGLDIREFKIVFTGPVSMPLWEAQLDVVVGEPFVQELGYLLVTRSRPLTRFGRPGVVDKNLPLSADGRFFLEGEELNLLADAEPGWEPTGWYYDGATQPGAALPLVFPAQDTTVTALFAPLSYGIWRTTMFYHANALLGTENDYTNEAISATEVDHDGDGLSNAGEYVFGGDPYTPDEARTRPQMLLVDVAGVLHPAIRYRSNGQTPEGSNDVVRRVRVKANGGEWQDNSGTPTTVTVSRELQPDGSALVTERALQPMSALTSVEMDVAWSVGGVEGSPLTPSPLAIETEPVLADGRLGAAYAAALAAGGGVEPYTWSVTGGALPPGLTLGGDGSLSGVPTTSGEFNFTAQVSDGIAQTTSQPFEITILPFEIITATPLTAHPLGEPAEAPLAVAGGTGPFSWQVIGGALPPGIDLSGAGVLTGTPSEAGLFEFTVQVTDTNDLTTSKTLTWAVTDLEIVTGSPLPVAVVNVPYNVALTAGNGTAPFTWAVTGGALPAGLNLSAEGVIQGTPTVAGNSSFTVQVTDAGGFHVSKVFDLVVSATYLPPVLDPIAFAPVTVGEEFVPYQLTAANYPKNFIVTGLPKGLKYVASTGVISGRVTAAGVYNVQVRAVNAGGSSATVSAPLVVRALPAGQTGTFTGLTGRDAAANGGLGGLLSLNTTPTGAFTVKIRAGSKTSSAKGFLNAAAPQVQATVNNTALALTLDADTGLVTGTHGAAAVSGWRLVWDKKANPASRYEGYYSVALTLADAEDSGVAAIPQGAGFATFTVAAAGTLKVAGKTADGQSLVSAATLGPDGQIAVYSPLYKNKGSALGEWMVVEDSGWPFLGSTVTGALTWSKPAAAGRGYAAGFGPLNLNVEGGYLASSPKKQVVLGLPEAGEVNLAFADGGLAESATDPDLANIPWTETYQAVIPAGRTLKVNKATGALNGTFTLTEPAPNALVRKNVKFFGQVVRTADAETKAFGYFLLPQIPASGQKPNTTPILSGAVFLTQPAAP